MAKSDRSAERFKYGICLNDECNLCKTKKVQQVPMRKELICSECGKPLRECPPPTPTGGWKKFAAIGVAALALIGGSYFALSGGGNKSEVVEPAPKDTVVVDTPPKEPEKENPKEVGEKTPDEDTKESPTPAGPTSGKVNLSYGVYDGPLSSGKPDGFGGTITITSTYDIDLKKASGETVTVNRGDKIMSVKMENGRLRQGEIHFADGTRKYISGL